MAASEFCGSSISKPKFERLENNWNLKNCHMILDEGVETAVYVTLVNVK